MTMTSNGQEPLDMALVRRISDRVSDRFANEFKDDDRLWDEESRDQQMLHLINDELLKYETELVKSGNSDLDLTQSARISEAVLDAASGLAGYGPLLKRNMEISDIHALDEKTILHYRDGRRERGPDIAGSAQEARNNLMKLAARSGYKGRFDSSSPSMDLSLPGGGRLHAVIASDRVFTTIRLHDTRLTSVSEWFAGSKIDQNFPPRLAPRRYEPTIEGFIAASSAALLNAIISASVGTGKTALVRAWLNEADIWERMVLIEDNIEILLELYGGKHQDVVELLATPPNIVGAGAVPISFWVRQALRMNYDRLVVGECRGAETADMLSAMSSGKGGSISTIHADTTRLAISRLRTRALMNQDLANLDSNALDEWIAGSVDLIIQLEKGNRYPRVLEVTEVTPSLSTSGVGMQMTPLFRWDGEQCRPVQRPSPTTRAKLQAAGYPVDETWAAGQ